MWREKEAAMAHALSMHDAQLLDGLGLPIVPDGMMAGDGNIPAIVKRQA
jgi:hypothetical protein